MASRKKPSAETKFTGSADIRKLWKAITAADWVALLQEVAPQYRWERQGHTVLRGLCPYHPESSPSFTISLHKGFGHCFGCGKFVYDPINLVAKLKSCSYVDALLLLHSRFDLKELGASADELSQYHRIQEAKKWAAIAMNQVLQKVIREDPIHLQYCRAAVAYLVKGRGLPIETLPALPVGVFARPEHLFEFVPNPILHTVIAEYFHEWSNDAIFGSVAFHYNDSPGTISKFKFRTLAPGAVTLASRFNSWQDTPESTAKSLITHDFVFVKDPYAEGIGVYGLHKYQPLVGRGDAFAYVTEGEFDALSVMAAQEAAGSTDFIMLAAGGAGGVKLSFLADYDIKGVWMIPDHPSNRGDGWACNILRCKDNFVPANGKQPMTFKIFQWPAALLGMDLDEAVRLNSYSSVKNFIYTQRNSFFLYSNPWVVSHAEKEAADISKQYADMRRTLNPEDPGYATETENLRADQKAAIKAVVLKWYAFLHDTAVQTEYAHKFSTEYDVDITQISEINNSLFALDTPNGVAEKIREALDKEFAVSYYEKKGPAGITLNFWSKKHDESVVFQTNEKEISILVSTYMGSEITTWLDSLLGDNPVYNHGATGDKTIDYLQRKKMAKVLFQHTLEQCYYGSCRNVASMVSLGQGIHYVDLPATVKANNHIFLANGSKLFKGTFTDSITLSWERVENQVSDGILFENLGESYRWSHVDDVSDLYAATESSPKETFDKVLDILNGWKFENHDIMAPYLAAYVMALPIMRAVGNVNITFITGDKESGKTSLLNGLLGGMKSKHEVPSLLEPAIFMSDATAAALYQTMHGSSQLFVLDEAEQSEKHNTSHDDNIKEIVRMLYSVPQGGVSIARGGATKDQRVEYFLRMPVIMAGIYLPTDSTFLSRVVVVYTVKDPGRQNLDDYIYDRFEEQDIEKLRKMITVGLLPKIPEIMSRRSVLRAKLSKLRGSVANVSNRFLDSILTPLVVYEVAGGDAEYLYTSILTRYKSRLEAIHEQDNINDIINACLYQPCIRTSQDEMSDIVNARSLIMNGEDNLLNAAESGVYYLRAKQWIVIIWRQAKFKSLRYTSYYSMEESSLRERCSKNQYVIPEITDEDHAYIQAKLRVQDVKASSGYTVIRADYLLQDIPVEDPSKPAKCKAKPSEAAEPSLVEEGVKWDS